MKKTYWTSIIITFCFVSCGTSKITDSWKANNENLGTYNKIMVLGLISNSESCVQEKMEDHMVGDLKDLGYNAISSLSEYGPKFFENMDEKTALTKIRNNGVDAVITIVMLDKKSKKDYVPAYIHHSPYGYYHDRFWNYQAVLYNRIYESDYYVTNTKYFWESNFYRMVDQKLIYSVQTESFDPSNSERLGHEYGKLIIKDMVRQKVFHK
ncbi:hypothetical protein [Flavobacterium sp.]|uniref:hypothetical protein n=1 Tax=Flavobacterium sp. TaxID=239 RepID=UPI003D6BCB3F